jgi:PhzF family phenazine biosynthesis protein
MPLVPLQGLQYRQVDVFAREALNGNGVAVFWNCGEMATGIMQGLTRELRQFEAIFLRSTGAKNQFRAKVFTMEEELDFAGHPVLGAASVLHEKYGHDEGETWSIVLNASTLEVTTRRTGESYHATMLQPKAEFLAPIVRHEEIEKVMQAVNLTMEDKHCPKVEIGTIKGSSKTSRREAPRDQSAHTFAGTVYMKWDGSCASRRADTLADRVKCS